MPDPIREALEAIAQMRTMPDDEMNRFTLAAVITLARKATPSLATYDAQRAADKAEIERLRKALEPFTGEKLPSRSQITVSYDRNGLRRFMSPLEIAMLRAHRAFLPDLPTPETRCANCDGERNCYCARAALTPKQENAR